MGIVTGAALSTFIGLTGTFGSISSASIGAGFYPSMDNCIEHIDYLTRDGRNKGWEKTSPPSLQPGDYGVTLKLQGNIIEYICHPQG